MKKIASIFAVLSTLCTFSASAAFIDFQTATIESYGRNQDKVGDVIPVGTSIELFGNRWKSVLGTFNVTSNTLLNFEFFSSVEAEISGIGLDINSANLSSDFSRMNQQTFQLAGTQTFGVGVFNTYNVGDGFVSFSINVGNFYTGSFDRLFLVLDNDALTPGVNSTFRNVEVCERGSCMTAALIPEPATLGLIALGLFGLRRKLK